jgi:LPXTG-motif cell wall-anchored protein
MKKIIVLTMIFCLILSMGIYAHPGNIDDQGGHFVRSNNTCVAYHYFKGENAGYEVIFNKYCKWADRESLKPITPNDASGTWIKYDKTYKVILTDAKPKLESDLCWSYYVEIDGKQIIKGQSINTKSLICNIKVKAMKGDLVIYKGSLKDEKLNENGFTQKTVVCLSDDQKLPPLYYVFDFKTCYDIIFNDSYTPIPTDTIRPLPSDTPTEQPTNNNNGDTLPKTGESNNMTLPILGLIVVIIGAGFGVFKLKHRN